MDDRKRFSMKYSFTTSSKQTWKDGYSESVGTKLVSPYQWRMKFDWKKYESSNLINALNALNIYFCYSEYMT